MKEKTDSQLLMDIVDMKVRQKHYLKALDLLWKHENVAAAVSALQTMHQSVSRKIGIFQRELNKREAKVPS